MLRENDQHLKAVGSKPFVIRHKRSDLRALRGCQGEWKANNFHFKSKYLTFVAVPTTETKKVQLYGQEQILPVFQATATRKRIPPMFTTRKPYRHLHDTLVRKNILRVLGRIPFSVAQIRKRIAKYSHPGQVAESKTEKYLVQQLNWLKQRKLVAHKKKKGLWTKLKQHTFLIDKDHYLAYHACWFYVQRLRSMGMRMENGLIGTVREEELALTKALVACERRSIDMEKIHQVANAIRSAPWWNVDASDDTHYECWDQTTKVMDLPTTYESIDREAEDLLRAYMKYPYHGERNIGNPIMLFKSIRGLPTPWTVGSLVHDGKELRMISTIEHDKALLCSLQNQRRPFKKPTPLAILKAAWKIPYTSETPPTVEDAAACFLHGGSPRPLMCQWKETEQGYHLEVQLFRYT